MKKTYCGNCREYVHAVYFGTDVDINELGQSYWVELFQCDVCGDFVEPEYQEDHRPDENK